MLFKWVIFLVRYVLRVVLGVGFIFYLYFFVRCSIFVRVM